MKLTDEAKRDILNFVLERVANVANKEYQKRVWIRGEDRRLTTSMKLAVIFSEMEILL